MPIPIPAPSPDELPLPLPGAGGGAPTLIPYRGEMYVRQPQDWAIEQERMRHDQALYQLGEWAFFVLMWAQVDFEAGLVERCSRCYGGAAKQTRVAEVYDQPRQNECPVCYGTTFEGGYRARIVRPAMITDVDETERQDRKGSMHPGRVNIQSTSDFRARNGDFLIRADGSRWQLGTPERIQVRTGFEHPGQLDDATAYTNIPGKLEERTSVAYTLPPTAQVARAVLTQSFRRPGDFSDYEILVGPLIPPGVID